MEDGKDYFGNPLSINFHEDDNPEGSFKISLIMVKGEIKDISSFPR
jgi:hypothetical protein